MAAFDGVGVRIVPWAQNSLAAYGKVTAPTAGQTIASLVLPAPAGLATIWNVTVDGYLGGTFVAADNDNVNFMIGATVVTQLVFPPAIALPQFQVLSDGTAATAPAVKAIAAGSAQAVYVVQLVATRIG